MPTFKPLTPAMLQSEAFVMGSTWLPIGSAVADYKNNVHCTHMLFFFFLISDAFFRLLSVVVTSAAANFPVPAQSSSSQHSPIHRQAMCCWAFEGLHKTTLKRLEPPLCRAANTVQCQIPMQTDATIIA